MKVGFGYEKKAVFQGIIETAVQNFFGGTIKTHEILRKQHFFSFLGYMLYIFPISAFLSKCPAGKKLGEISTKIKHKKQIFGENCCEQYVVSE